MKKVNKRFFENERLEIGRVLIEELTNWESAKKPTVEEFCRLIDRLFEAKKLAPKKKKPETKV